MDNHESHEIFKFIKLANKNHILSYPLIPYFMHCMQPLDVGVFQPYKYWHDVAIQDALTNLDIEYNIRSFLHNLFTIRENTFKKESFDMHFRIAECGLLMSK